MKIHTLKALSNRGFSHTIIPIAVVVLLVAVAGTYLQLSGHANSLNKKLPPMTPENTIEEGTQGIETQNVEAKASAARNKPRKAVLRFYNGYNQASDNNEFFVKVYGCGRLKQFQLDRGKSRSMSCNGESKINIWYFHTNKPISQEKWRHIGPFVVNWGDVRSITMTYR